MRPAAPRISPRPPATALATPSPAGPEPIAQQLQASAANRAAEAERLAQAGPSTKARTQSRAPQTADTPSQSSGPTASQWRPKTAAKTPASRTFAQGEPLPA